MDSYLPADMQILRLFRPVNLILIVIIQYIIQYHIIVPYAGQHITSLTHLQFIQLCLVTLCLAASGYLINDIYDSEIDAINKPGKDLAAYNISKKNARILYFAILALGLLITISIGPPYLLTGVILYVITAAALWLYSARLKQTPLWGNIIVSLFSGLAVYILWVAQQMVDTTSHEMASYAHGVVLMYSLFAFLATLIREIVKDMEDVRGDSMYGARTFPVVFGIRPAKTLGIVLSIVLISVLAIWVFNAYETAPFNVLALFCATVVIPLTALIPLLIFARDQKSFNQISQYLKAVMLFATANLIFL